MPVAPCFALWRRFPDSNRDQIGMQVICASVTLSAICRCRRDLGRVCSIPCIINKRYYYEEKTIARLQFYLFFLAFDALMALSLAFSLLCL